MYRVASGLGALKRHGANAQMMNAAIRCASTSVAQRSSGGFWTWLTGARSNEIPPPDFTLPGVTIPPPLPDHVEAGKTRVTTLPNGENYTASRIVLAASGVDHDELVSIAEPLLSDIPSVSGTTRPKSTYIGGEYRRSADSSSTDVALAFEVPSGWLKEKDCVTVSVLQALLGGGGKFSWGRQGKGLHSRLNRLVNEFDQIKSISAFKDVHSNTGIFGIHTSTDASFVPKAIDLAARELTSLATPGQVDQSQLDRAKASAKYAILANLESQASLTEDMGRQVLAFGERKPAEHLLKAVDGVTMKDITSVAEKIISSPLTMASHGNVLNMPTYESVSGKFRSK
ncbi:Mitochondrial-processing peptidase subunit alpha [Zea mays]|uniref:Mitochondrial-processing peptidase subunit alpha n=1 Tax=Zea mays TaxID=4577 RepID=A0A3L6FD25_MAIZE|nr:Mitochondrial-processing peptidase subunit alpha [Zea mays]